MASESAMNHKQKNNEKKNKSNFIKAIVHVFVLNDLVCVQWHTANFKKKQGDWKR